MINNLCLSTDELFLAQADQLPPDREDHLRTCSLCSTAVDSLMLDDTDIVTAAELRATVARLYHKDEAPRRRSAIMRTLRIITSVAAILTLMWAAYTYSGDADTETWDALAFVEQPYVRVTRSLAGDDDYYKPAAELYRDSSYGLSTEYYRGLIDSAATPFMATRGHYELGIALWQNGQQAQAIGEMTAARLGEPDFYEDATWALAQFYRATSQFPEAEQLYTDLLYLNGGPYIERAENALAAMRSEQPTE